MSFCHVSINRKAKGFSKQSAVRDQAYFDRLSGRVPNTWWSKLLYHFKDYKVVRYLLGGAWCSYIVAPGTPQATMYWKWLITTHKRPALAQFKTESYK
jgi:hypothetical protein